MKFRFSEKKKVVRQVFTSCKFGCQTQTAGVYQKKGCFLCHFAKFCQFSDIFFSRNSPNFAEFSGPENPRFCAETSKKRGFLTGGENPEIPGISRNFPKLQICANFRKIRGKFPQNRVSRLYRLVHG